MRLSAVFLLVVTLASPLFAATAADHAAAANAALARRDDARAAELFEKAIALEPGNPRYHFLLGSAYGRMARNANVFKQASLATKTKAAFERAVQLDPRYTEAHFALIQYYLLAPAIMGGGDDKALAQAATIKKYDLLAGHRAYARVYNHHKKHELARKEMMEAVRALPRSAAAHYYLGNAYMSEQNWTAAQHEYATTLKLDPSFMPVYFRLGYLAARSGKDHARGEESLRKYLTHVPGDDEPSLAAAWYWLGKIQESQGRRSDARTSYLNAQKLAPDDKDIAAAVKRVS